MYKGGVILIDILYLPSFSTKQNTPLCFHSYFKKKDKLEFCAGGDQDSYKQFRVKISPLLIHFSLVTAQNNLYANKTPQNDSNISNFKWN